MSASEEEVLLVVVMVSLFECSSRQKRAQTFIANMKPIFYAAFRCHASLRTIFAASQYAETDSNSVTATVHESIERKAIKMIPLLTLWFHLIVPTRVVSICHFVSIVSEHS